MAKIEKTLSYINTERKGKGTGTEQSSASSRSFVGPISALQGDYLLKSIWDKVFEIRTDSNGNEYIFGKLPVATQYGITMYAGNENLDIPSIYAGIPVDGTTITKREDGTLTINPDIKLGGASNWDELEGIPSWITDSKPKYSYNEIEGAPDLSKYALNEDIKNLVTRNTDQIISGYKNFEKGLAINGLSITNTKDDIIYLDANLVIRGGLVIYADDTVDVPNLIDSLPKASYEVPGLAAFDSTYFVVDINGKVTLIPDNVGLNETELHSYLTSNGYATQTWVTSKNYATIGALNALEDKIDSFLEGSDTDTIINKWKELEAFLSGLSESDNLAVILSNKVDKSDLIKYVTIADKETITGEKNFTGGLKVNGSPIYYDTEKKYWKFEGDLLVTGGVTMYGNDSEFIPSTIMDAIQTDGVTIRVNPTTKNLEVIGILNGATTLGGLSNVGTWADSVADVDRIMYQAAGSSNWVAKSLSSIGGGGGVSGDYLPLSGGVINSTSEEPLTINSSAAQSRLLIQRYGANRTTVGHHSNFGSWIYDHDSGNSIGISVVDGSPFFNDGLFKTLIHSGNYSSYALPLDGSASMKDSINWGEKVFISGLSHAALRIDTPSGYIQLGPQNTSYCHIYTDRDSFYFNKSLLYANGNTIWHSGNDGSGSGLDADLLDGLESGYFLHYAGFWNNANSASGRDALSITYWADGQTGYWSTYGTSLNFHGGAGMWHNSFACRTDGYIDFYQGINTTTMAHRGTLAYTWSNVASATKLQTARTIWGQSFDGTGDIGGNCVVTGTLTTNQSWSDGATIHIKDNRNDGYGGYQAIRFYYNNENQATIHYFYNNYNGYSWTKNNLNIGAQYITLGDWNNPVMLVDNVTRNVGIGTTSPAYKAHIYTSDSYGLCIDRQGLWNTHISNDDHGGYIACNGVLMMNLNYPNKQVVIGYVGYSTINLLVTGGFTMYSDKRKKTILNHVELSLKQIAEAPLIEHYYNGDDKKTTHVGSIAQYWANMNDWFCKLDSEGYYTMEIQNCALASAISIARELDRYETKTDKAIKKLKKRICELEEEVEQLRSRL